MRVGAEIAFADAMASAFCHAAEAARRPIYLTDWGMFDSRTNKSNLLPARAR